VGFKGAFGRVPLDGVVPLATSLDHAGPIARSVADVALLQAVLEDRPGRPVQLERPRLAVSRELFNRAEPALRSHLELLLSRFADGGAIVTEIALPPSFAGIVEAGVAILEAEAAASHRSLFATHGDDYGPGIAGLVRAGLARSASDVARAEDARVAFHDAMVPLLEACDVLLSPVASGPAPLRSAGTGDFSLCAPWTFIGMPAISIPTGLDEGGLPLALQLVAGPDGSGRLLGAAAWCERVIGFSERPMD
jgi:amidase